MIYYTVMKKIAVLMGGTSSERAVSLTSGRNVAEALASQVCHLSNPGK